MRPTAAGSKACFGPFEADLGTGELWRDGARIVLQAKPFQLLAALLERPGELVTREELHKRLWPQSVFTDFEHGLNKAVSKLRQALDDLAEEPRYVETLPKRGYRFVAPLARGASQPKAAAYRLLHEGRSYPLAAGVNLIGREPGSALCLDASSVSRRHAEILVAETGATLRDLGSKNGTFVRGARIRDGVTLADGDDVTIGTVRVEFRSAGRESTVTASGGSAAR